MKMIQGALIFLLALVSEAQAASVTVPNSFSAGAPARAAEVNANFTALANAINANAGDIAALQSSASAAGFNYRGGWASSTAYAKNDVVTDSGSSYVALKASTGVAPAADVSGNWALISRAGTPGVAGPPGPTGPMGGLVVVNDSGLVLGPYVTLPPAATAPQANVVFPTVGNPIYEVAGGGGSFVMVSFQGTLVGIPIGVNYQGVGSISPKPSYRRGPVVNRGRGDSQRIYYPTADCSGQGYMKGNYGVLPIAAVRASTSSVAQVLSRTPTNDLYLGSYMDESCTAEALAPQDYMYRVLGAIDLTPYANVDVRLP